MSRIFCTLFLIFGFIQFNSGDDVLCDFFENLAYNISEPCLKQLHTVCNNFDLKWKMFDASSKFLTSGMTYSNVIDYGNFPECLSIDYADQDGPIIGKYCGLSVIIVNIFLTPQTDEILTRFGYDTNATSVQTITADTFSQMDREFRDIMYPDIPYVISKYSSCVPDACTPQEVGYFYLFGHLPDFNIPLILYTGIECETVNSNTDYEAGDIVMITFFVVIAVLLIASTIYDALCQNFTIEPYHPLFVAFSILYNGKKLLQISNDTTEQIQCFNGMRFISMMWVVAYHAASVFEVGAIGLENFPEALAWNDNWSTQYIISGLLAVDTFFFISGFLLAYSYVKSSSQQGLFQQLFKVPKMYLHRYLRLTPSVGVMYLVTITIFRFFGSGPTWSFITHFIKDACKNRWWEFFLYLQNYTHPDDMCIVPTWYLSADMQMFILAPLVLIPVALYVNKSLKKVIWGLVGLTILAIIIPMLTRYFVDDAAGNIYTAHERFSNFLIGITFGVVMRLKKHKSYIFTPFINLLLWVVVIVVSLAFNIYWHYVISDYDLLTYTLFMGFYRPIWCLCLVFMVYSCYHNQGGIVQWLLTRPAFQILGRLSYSMYVLHFLVEIYAGGTLKTVSYFSNYFLFYNWCGHIIVTMILSVFWVLAFEFPMLTIDKFLLGDGKKRAPKPARQVN